MDSKRDLQSRQLYKSQAKHKRPARRFFVILL